MKLFLKYVSCLIALVTLGTSCSSSKYIYDTNSIIGVTESSTQKYNLQLDFKKHHFSGMLLIKEMNRGEIRIVGTTYFGMSLFDFSLTDGSFLVNYCIEPLKRKKLLLLLESDFRQLLLTNQKRKIKSKANYDQCYGFGRWFGKTLICIDENEGVLESVKLRHTWIGLQIQLDPIDNKFSN